MSGSVNQEEMIYYLEKNSKCKLPWSNFELKVAKSNAMQLYKQRIAIQKAEKVFSCNSTADITA